MLDSWPIWGLRLTVRDLVLTPMREADLGDVVATLPADLELDPHAIRFPGLAEPHQRAVVACQEYWRHFGTWSTTGWRLNFCVRRDGELLGVQELEGNDFPTLRTVDTSSWLRPTERGRGTGKAMRAAVLDLAFERLGAVAAITSAWHDNHASLGVSRALGYRDNGISLMRREPAGTADTLVHLRLTRQQWAGRQPPTEITGFEPCRPFFGI